MSKRLLALFSGAIALLLFASAPAEAELFRSNLVCSDPVGTNVPAAGGFTVIKNHGDLYVQLRAGTAFAGAGFSCAVVCGNGVTAEDPTCGDRVANGAGTLTTISRGLGSRANLGVIACPSPVVTVQTLFGTGLECQSGFVTPQ